MIFLISHFLYFLYFDILMQNTRIVCVPTQPTPLFAGLPRRVSRPTNTYPTVVTTSALRSPRELHTSLEQNLRMSGRNYISWLFAVLVYCCLAAVAATAVEDSTDSNCDIGTVEDDCVSASDEKEVRLHEGPDRLEKSTP